MEERPAVQRHRLANGLRCALWPRRELPLVAVNLWYRVGSVDDPADRTGLAHLFEHMLFQGSAHVRANEHFERIQEVGGVANGSTWYERTNYYQTVPATALDLALWLESDRMGFLLEALDDRKLETQRSVVLNERSQRVDNQPYGRAVERIHEALYPEGHPMRAPVIGYRNHIEAIDRDDVEDFYRRHYSPANAVLSLVGDVAVDAALERVEHWFGDLPATGARASRQPLDRDGAPEDAALRAPVRLAQLWRSHRVEGYGTEAWDRHALLSVVLAGGRSSYLVERLVHAEESAQTVAASVLPVALDSRLTLSLSGRPGQSSRELETALDGALRDLSHRGLEDAERERALDQLRTSHWAEWDSLDRQADALSMGLSLFDDPTRTFEDLDRLAAVTLEDLETTLASLVESRAGSTVTVDPESS